MESTFIVSSREDMALAGRPVEALPPDMILEVIIQ